MFMHELVHALRYMGGKVGKLTDAKEELIAILVTNIFSSETNRKLRLRHDDYTELTDPVNRTSSGYFQNNRALIETFSKQNENVSRWLGTVQTAFNPLAEYWAQVPASAGGWKARP